MDVCSFVLSFLSSMRGENETVAMNLGFFLSLLSICIFFATWCIIPPYRIELFQETHTNTALRDEMKLIDMPNDLFFSCYCCGLSSTPPDNNSMRIKMKFASWNISGIGRMYMWSTQCH